MRQGVAAARAGLLATCVVALAGSTSSMATPPSGGRDAAMAMGRLFGDSCLRHAGDAAGLRAALASPRFRAIPHDLARTVLPKPGQAFEEIGSPGHLMVLSFDDGWCGDGGTGIDPAVLTNILSRVVGDAYGGTMKLMGADPDGREQRYMIERPRRAPVALLVLLTPADASSGGPALMQASLFASEMRTPGEGHP